MKDFWVGSPQQCAHFINTLRMIRGQTPIPHTGSERGVKKRRAMRTGGMNRQGGRLELESGAYSGLPLYGRSGGRNIMGSFALDEPL